MKNNSSPIRDFMGRIDDMTIARKTSLLFTIMLIGMLFIGSFAHLSLKRIKDNFDILYTKQMVPVIKLEKIKDIYTVNILDTLKDIENNHISANDGKDIILLAQDLISRDWTEYKGTLGADENDWTLKVAKSLGSNPSLTSSGTHTLEGDIVKIIELKIKKINLILLKIFNDFDKSNTADAYNAMAEDLYPSVNSINIQITQLIGLNLEAATNGQKRTEAVYENTFEWIVVATVGTVSVAALLAIVILQNIRVLYSELARIVNEKTKELQELNSDLEKKIAYEVEQSRQKDQIMFEQSRFAAMGEMVGNIAHQWRQPLNALVLVVQSFQMKKMVGKLDDKFIDEQVDEGMKLASSMSKTIDDFRNFFKPNRQEETFSINDTIKEAMDLVKVYYTKLDININLVCRNDFDAIGYPNEFTQVIMNLLSNSKDILCDKKKQKLNIEILVNMDKEKKVGKISVIDNGGGIDDAVIDRMFEPYFTTKHQSSGTGIGLYMSKEIIAKHMNGYIWAENISYKFGDEVCKKCACINITIPILDKKEA
jgi:signal transduction histidine kinase